MAQPLLPDDLWAIVEPLLPAEPPKPKGGQPRVSDRAALTVILFVLKSGIPWELLPAEMGCGSGVTCWRPPSAAPATTRAGKHSCPYTHVRPYSNHVMVASSGHYGLVHRQPATTPHVGTGAAIIIRSPTCVLANLHGQDTTGRRMSGNRHHGTIGSDTAHNLDERIQEAPEV